MKTFKVSFEVSENVYALLRLVGQQQGCTASEAAHILVDLSISDFTKDAEEQTGGIAQ